MEKHQEYAKLNEDFLMFDEYVGKRVIIEEEKLGSNISAGILIRHGENMICFLDYHKFNIDFEKLKNIIDNHPEHKIKSNYNIRQRLISKSCIASLQSLEDVFGDKNSKILQF